MSEPGQHHVPARRRLWPRRLIKAVVGLLLLALILVLGWSLYSRIEGSRRLDAAIAEADRLDPGWRWEEIRAKRPSIPANENSASHVLDAAKLIPDHWPTETLAGTLGTNAQEDALVVWDTRDLAPPVQLNAKQLTALRLALNRAGPAIPEARALRDTPRGRFPPQPSTLLTNSTALQNARNVANLLRFDAIMRAHNGDIDGALASLRGMVNAGRSVADEPGLVSLLVRMACASEANKSLERTLAQGKPSEEALAELQKLLEDEWSQPALLTALRGERALQQTFLESMYDQISGGSWLDRVELEIMRGRLKAGHATVLRISTEAVEIAKLPIEEQRERFRQLDQRIEQMKPRTPRFLSEYAPDMIPVLHSPEAFAFLMFPAISKVVDAYFLQQARLGCAIVAVAAERYRLAHDKWPESLDQLMPKFLSKVPVDPFGKGALRMRQLDDGLVIYSVGPNAVDDGGRLGAFPDPGTDLGFRLWDVSKRRQPPPAVPPPEE